MKKIVSYILILAAVLSLSACKAFDKAQISTEPEDALICAYDVKHAPSQVVKTDNYWVLLVSEYWGTNYRISVSEDPEELNVVYATDNVIIWYIEANDDAVVWCEETVDTYDYKVYSMQEDSVETLLSISQQVGYQPQTVGVYEDRVYYPLVDYQSQKADVLCYDIKTKETSSVYSVPYSGEYSIMTMSVEENYLSIATATDIVVINLLSGEVLQTTAIPEEIGFVYAISYDKANQKCALYYADQDSEDIGFISENGEMDSHYTFGNKQYAFEDKIKCVDGFIYWIIQADTTGEVTDHYRYVEYDYLNHEPCEIKRVFNLEVGEDYKYYLAFDEDGDYQKIELYER